MVIGKYLPFTECGSLRNLRLTFLVNRGPVSFLKSDATGFAALSSSDAEEAAPAPAPAKAPAPTGALLDAPNPKPPGMANFLPLSPAGPFFFEGTPASTAATTTAGACSVTCVASTNVSVVSEANTSSASKPAKVLSRSSASANAFSLAIAILCAFFFSAGVAVSFVSAAAFFARSAPTSIPAIPEVRSIPPPGLACVSSVSFCFVEPADALSSTFAFLRFCNSFALSALMRRTSASFLERAAASASVSASAESARRMPKSVAVVVLEVDALAVDALLTTKSDVMDDDDDDDGRAMVCAALAAPAAPNKAAMDTSAALPARCIAGSLGLAGAACSTEPGGLHCDPNVLADRPNTNAEFEVLDLPFDSPFDSFANRPGFSSSRRRPTASSFVSSAGPSVSSPAFPAAALKATTPRPSLASRGELRQAGVPERVGLTRAAAGTTHRFTAVRSAGTAATTGATARRAAVNIRTACFCLQT